MVESTDKIKVKKDYNKIGTEDDPIIIAQRFLNIFRQLHIFTDERKQAFNQMILEQPAEVRGIFSSLPGGGVLQQYVDDLEAKNGIVRSIPDAAPQVDYEEEAKAKILATALAEANSQQHSGNDNSALLAAQMAAESAAKVAAETQVKMAEQAALEAKAAAAKAQEQLQVQAKALAQFQELLKNKNINKEDIDVGKVTPTAIFQPISSTVTADGDFAKEIASALKEAISVTDDNRKKDSENLTKAIIDSQNKLAEIMAQNNSANIEAQNRLAQMLVQNNTANTANNANANNIQINTAATFPPVEEMISGIVKVQSELFKEMAKTQTSELSAIISLALKESQQLSTQSIITAIKEMQKENLKFLQMHPVVYSSRTEPQKPVHPSETQDEVIDEQNTILPPDLADDEESISAPNLEIDSISENELDEPQSKKKKKNQEGLSLDGIASSLLDKVSSLTDKVTSLTAKKEDENTDILHIEPEDNNNEILPPEDDDIELPKLENDNNGLDMSLFDSEPEKSTPQVEDIQSFSDITSSVDDANNNVSTDEDVEWEYEEVPAEEILQQLDNFSTNEEKDTSLTSSTNDIQEDNSLSEAADSDASWHRVSFASDDTSELDNNTLDVTPALSEGFEEEKIETSTNVEQPLVDKNSWLEEKPTTDENFAPEEKNFEENASSDAFFNSNTSLSNGNDDNGFDIQETASSEEQTFNSFDEYASDIDNAPTQIADTENFAGQQNYEQNEAPLPQEMPAEAEKADEQDWEWEYEEVPEGEAQASEQAAAPEAENADGQDWEWEYEEVPEDEAQSSEQIAASEAENADGQDWEWEYEEVPEDEAQSSEQAAAPEAENADGQDWEWDYEEVPEGEAQASEQAAAPEAENADGQDWEWEYEEVPEGEAQASEQVAGAEGTEGQDWEWEYEEASEESENTQSLPEQIQESDGENAIKFANSFDDPYHPENTSTSEETSPLSSIYSGEVYFQDKVYQQPTEEDSSHIDVPENIADNFPLSDTDDKDEPYKPKTTI